jgi:ribosome assembly protein RRB1
MSFMIGMDVDEKEEEEEENDKDLKLYLPGQPLAEGEVLEADPSVYVMLHNLDVRLPFLSFDVLEDKLGDERKNVSKMVSVHEIFDL